MNFSNSLNVEVEKVDGWIDLSLKVCRTNKVEEKTAGQRGTGVQAEQALKLQKGGGELEKHKHGKDKAKLSFDYILIAQ